MRPLWEPGTVSVGRVALKNKWVKKKYNTRSKKKPESKFLQGKTGQSENGGVQTALAINHPNSKKRSPRGKPKLNGFVGLRLPKGKKGGRTKETEESPQPRLAERNKHQTRKKPHHNVRKKTKNKKFHCP